MSDVAGHRSDSVSPLDLLLVEDNLADATIISTILKDFCPTLSISVVRDGEEAVDYLMRRGNFGNAPRPQAVLMDLNLPKKSGFEVLAEMRAEPTLRSLPVFMLTTSSSNEDRARAKALGVISFITKPAGLEELEATLAHLCNVEFPRLFGETVQASPSPNLASAPATVDVENYRRLVEAVGDYAIFMLDRNGYVITWNEGAFRIKQYSASEILGKHFSVFYPSEEIRAGHPEYELRIAQKEGRYQEEGWRLRKDGSRFWANVTITAIRDKGGELIGYGKVTRDMTERRLAELRLVESEERFRVLVDGIRDCAIFMLDPKGYIVSWNRGAERINGYEAAEVLGKHFSIFYTQKDIDDKHPQRELVIAKEKGSYQEEGIRIRRDGSPFWADVLLTALHTPSGELRGYAKVTRDITNRKKAEHEIHELTLELEKRVTLRTAELEESRRLLQDQRDDLIRSNSDLQQFAFIASHDLQEPLRMVITNLQYFERRAGQSIDPELMKFVNFATSGAVRLRKLVMDLLAFARIERASYPAVPVNLRDVIEELKRQLASTIEETGTRIHVLELPAVPIETTHIAQIFQNLIANAIQYRHPDRSPEITIGAEKRATEYRLFVRDNGMGIAPEYWEKIFAIFQRLHSDPHHPTGTGMGLAITKRIVERYGGKIDVQSEPNVGSTFRFTLPIEPA